VINSLTTRIQLISDTSVLEDGLNKITSKSRTCMRSTSVNFQHLENITKPQTCIEAQATNSGRRKLFEGTSMIEWDGPKHHYSTESAKTIAFVRLTRRSWLLGDDLQRGDGLTRRSSVRVIRLHWVQLVSDLGRWSSIDWYILCRWIVRRG
jgi:hypothetical protein